MAQGLAISASISQEVHSFVFQNKAKLTAEDKEKNLPIHLAAKNDQPKSIALLLEAGASIDAQNAEGNTPLHMAIRAKAFLALKLLIEKGANIYMKNKQGSSLLVGKQQW